MMSDPTETKQQDVPVVYGKMMKLRCRLRPLFEGYFVNDQIADRDADVIFECRGGSTKAHRLILSVVSKFFVDIFKDQKPGKVSVVLVPDIPVGIMKLILKLCYKQHITLNMNSMKDIGNYLSLFGLAWEQFNFTEEPEEEPSPKKTLPTVQVQTASIGNASSQPVKISLQDGGLRTSTSAAGASLPKTIMYRAGGKIITTIPKDAVRGGMQTTYILDGFNIQAAGPDGVKTFLRPILPKPSGIAQLAVNRASGGPPILQRMSPSNGTLNKNGSRSEAQITPVVETDVGASPSKNSRNTSPAEKSINQWIASVGRDSVPPKLSKPSPLKRRSPPAILTASSLKGSTTKSARLACSVCSSCFDDQAKWKWHEDRHVGINLFKCTLCQNIFSTSRQVYQHEMMEHGLLGALDDRPGKAQDEGEEEEQEEDEDHYGTEKEVRLLGHLPVGEEKRRATVVKTLYGSHYRRLSSGSKAAADRTKLNNAKNYKIPSYSKLHHNFSSRNSLIGIGNHEGEHLIESRKLKQLHWLYVCSKCENCADSSAKAVAHFKVCYGEKGPKFEETVVKYRQGFYGKCKCPLCPRRYTSLGGFLIHCGHMHQEYRKVFSHINSEDTLMCVNCRDKFDDPGDFHSHLGEDLTCNQPSQEDLSTEQASTPSEGRPKPLGNLIGHNPRSARLQKRLAAVTACFEDDPPAEEESLSPVTCPICGEPEVGNIGEHLATSHSELDITVERTGEGSLQCRTCGITFAVCDLLAHNNSCTGSKSLNHIAEKKAAMAAAAKQKTPVKVKPIEYPPGIGESPIETMERTDLMSIDVLREALCCGVCKRVGRKMNIVAECLRTHGVYRCAICFNSYLSREQASRHLKKCHSTNSGKAICPICRIVRSNAGQVTSHMYLTHWLPVLRDHEVDMKKNRLLSQLKESQEGKEETLDSSTTSAGIETEEETSNASATSARMDTKEEALNNSTVPAGVDDEETGPAGEDLQDQGLQNSSGAVEGLNEGSQP